MYKYLSYTLKAVNTVLDKSNANRIHILDSTDQEKMFDILTVLQYFYDATLELSKTIYSGISTVMPVFYSLCLEMKATETDSSLTCTLKKVLLYHIKFYMSKYLEKNEAIYSAAAFLDVRTKNFSFAAPAQKRTYVKMATDLIKDLLSEGPPDIAQRASSRISANSSSNNQ